MKAVARPKQIKGVSLSELTRFLCRFERFYIIPLLLVLVVCPVGVIDS